ncbi:hypothetical protein LTR29_001048 [Friedmanniomyces endolithicus]|nr:hypothetical protein LTR29_001048 [Friedmanniomyces endolithicus]
MASSSPTKAPPTKVSRSASCLCGAVAITITGVDKGAVLCHCSNCQKSSGSSFAHNYRFLDADLTFDKGEDAVTRYEDGNTTNGNVLARHFCKVCVRDPLAVFTFFDGDLWFQCLLATVHASADVHLAYWWDAG